MVGDRAEGIPLFGNFEDGVGEIALAAFIAASVVGNLLGDDGFGRRETVPVPLTLELGRGTADAAREGGTGE